MGISSGKAQLLSAIAEAITYGINLVVFIAAITLIWTRRERNRKDVIVTLGVMTVLMFAVATLHFAAMNEITFDEFIVDQEPSELTSRTGVSPQIQSVATEVINCFMGDSLVIWRAWGLWGHSYRAILAPASLWVATLFVGTVGIWLTSIPLDSVEAVHTYSSLMVTWAALVLATNMWTVGMTSSVYWRYHQEVIVVVGRRKAVHRTILIFLIESGALYCFTWAVMMVFIVWKHSILRVMLQLLPQFTCLYPTLIIVVVCLGLTQQDQMDSDCTMSTQQVAQRPIEFRRADESTFEMRANALLSLPARRSTDASSIADKTLQDG